MNKQDSSEPIPDLTFEAGLRWAINLPEEKQTALVLALTAPKDQDEAKENADMLLKRFPNNEPVCPHCGSHGKGVTKNGVRKGVQRYRCRHCCKSFTLRTGSVFAYTKTGMGAWKKFLNCMMQGKTIRKSAAECGIHRTTAFAWRHKILDALANMMDGVRLEGVVESDETFFALSYKGNHKNSKRFALPRKAHERGGDVHKQGLSHDQVCVPCAVTRHGFSIARATNSGRATGAGISMLLDGKIAEGSKLCTDSDKAYLKFARKNKLEHIRIAPKRRVSGKYGIQVVNNYHSQMKAFMGSFKGVSTKYLNNYLVWFNFVVFSSENHFSKEFTFLDFLRTTTCFSRGYSLSWRPSTPFPMPDIAKINHLH